jgi:ribulose-5-phosphate 4-epimerase/fuculose-1-phosphate aldolase
VLISPTTKHPQKCDDEGIIKFELKFNHAPPQELKSVAELNAWRQILHRLGLTGLDSSRYQGLAYGNVSRREGPNRFIVSGTQTGAKNCLTPDDYCLVLDFDLAKNHVHAEGPIKPSSEALTHGAIYAANSHIECVLHAHSPVIWRYATQLGIYQTDASIASGTPEMGQAVGQAVRNLNSGIISMGGHEDGLIAFADTIWQAAVALVKCLAKAEELEFLTIGKVGKRGNQSR